jgi:hypothetical protein
MKTIRKIVICSILVIALTSCSAFAPKPTQTPIPTGTSLPTLTATAEPSRTPTLTDEPTSTAVPPTKTPIPSTYTPSAPVLPMPSGEPLSNWEGFPVMPNAIAGDGDSQGYSFTIKATSEEVQKFYALELSKLGWNMFATGQGSKNNSVLLIFLKGTDTASVTIIPQEGDLLYVLLVKS